MRNVVRIQTNKLTIAGMVLLVAGGTILLLEGHVDAPPRTLMRVGFATITVSLILYLLGRILMFVRDPFK